MRIRFGFFGAGCMAAALLVAPAMANRQNGLSGIIAPGAKVEKLDSGFKFIEGPVWMPQGFLLFSDIPSNALMKWKPGGKATIWRQPSGHTNGNTLDLEGRLISCNHDRVVTRTEKSGKITVLASKYGNDRLNSPNDVVVKSDGAIYFTDPPYGIKPEGAGL
jgi:gluconolactonase